MVEGVFSFLFNCHYSRNSNIFVIIANITIFSNNLMKEVFCQQLDERGVLHAGAAGFTKNDKNNTGYTCNNIWSVEYKRRKI